MCPWMPCVSANKRPSLYVQVMVSLCALVMSLLHPGYILPRMSDGASPSWSVQLVTTEAHVNPVYIAP